MSEGFEDYCEAAPDGLWSAVSGTLSRQRRRRRLLAGASAAFACAAAAALLLYLPGRPADVHRQPFASRPLVADIPLERGIAPAAGLSPESGTPRGAGVEIPSGVEIPAGLLPPSCEPLPETGPETGPESATETDSALLPEESADGGKAPQKDIRRTADIEDDPFAVEAASATKRHRSRLALNLAFSGHGPSSSSSEGYSAMYGSGVSAAVASLSDPAGLSAAGPLPGVLLENNFREVGTDTRHYRPVRFALSLAWEFVPHLSLVSGVGYSYLVSDMSSGTRDSRYDIRQTLHYVGVPLSLNWSLPLAPRLDFYLSGGGMVEKCVYGQSVTSYIIDSRRQGQDSSRIAVEPLQWSVRASAGLAWRFSDRMGGFVEPGLVRYFDNGSPVQTVYGARPLNFDLSLGLRLSLP